MVAYVFWSKIAGIAWQEKIRALRKDVEAQNKAKVQFEPATDVSYRKTGSP